MEVVPNPDSPLVYHHDFAAHSDFGRSSLLMPEQDWCCSLMGRCTLFPSFCNEGTGAHYHISTLSLHMPHRPERLLLTVVRSFEVLHLFCRCGSRSVVSGDH